MRHVLWTTAFVCSFATASPLTVFGVTLGARPDLPACAIGLDSSALSPETGACINHDLPNYASVVLALDSCPTSYFRSCDFSLTLNDAGEVVGYWISTSGLGSEQAARTALIEKFGKPTASEAAPVQNRFGAGFVNHAYRWDKKGYTVEYTELWKTTDVGRIMIETPQSLRIKARRAPADVKM